MAEKFDPAAHDKHADNPREAAAADRDLAEAIRLVSVQLETDQAGGSDAYNLAVYQAGAGQLGEARGDLARAIERFPDLILIGEAADDLRDLGEVPGMDAPGIALLIRLLDEAKVGIEAAGAAEDTMGGRAAD